MFCSMELYKKRKDLIHFNWLIFFITFYTVYFCDVLVFLNHSNKITRNWDVFAGCSETRISVVIKHVQHIGIIRAFCLPGGDLLSFQRLGTDKLLHCGFRGGSAPRLTLCHEHHQAYVLRTQNHDFRLTLILRNFIRSSLYNGFLEPLIKRKLRFNHEWNVARIKLRKYGKF